MLYRNVLGRFSRYVPLFLLLIGIKMCLLSLITDAIRQHHHPPNHHHHHRSSVSSEKHSNNRIKKNVHHYSVENISKFSHPIVKNHHPPEGEVARVPDNIMEMEINPSGKNRTSSKSIWLVYNSVPQCGDHVTADLIEHLATKNGFAHQEHEYQTPWPRFLLPQEQSSLVEWFQYQHLPKSYNRHFFFVNFTRFQKFTKEKPIYINIVRDPIDRLVLDYHSRRNKSSSITKQEVNRLNAIRPGSGTEWYHRTFEECVLQADPECRYTAGEKSFTLMIPFFCGHHNSCVVINDRWALQMAKFNIESEYSVVGVLEKMDQTLIALEKLVPRFFAGATQLYNEFGFGMQHRMKQVPVISTYTRQLMESELYNEVELYRFIRRRLAVQMQASRTNVEI